ncbi:MAG: LAO/AO transport system kinase [Glaciecola sp.]
MTTTDDAVDVEALVSGVLARDVASLGRAVTLVESRAARHRPAADALLARLSEHAGGAIRIGITGVPGVGKSTFIDALGTWLVNEQDLDVAVLAVDPTSTRTGGSILGDKTRMAGLAMTGRSFIRPSPAAGTLGGVARATRESMVVVEAAGFDVVLVETVGVGQSEVAVAAMVDTFLVLALPGAGDTLQGIKKGVLELADLIAVNKADGDRRTAAEVAARDYRTALSILQPASDGWQPEVLLISAIERRGLDELWGRLAAHRAALERSGVLDSRRREQQVRWLWELLEARLLDDFRRDSAVASQIASVEQAVKDGTLPASAGAAQLLDRFRTP